MKTSFLKIMTWTELAKFGEIKIFRYSYIFIIAVPIIAKFSQKYPDKEFFAIADKIYIPNFFRLIEIPFNWQILFLAATFIAISTTIYFFCPTFVKIYPSFDMFNVSGTTGNYCYHQINSDGRTSDFIKHIFESYHVEDIQSILSKADPELDRRFTALIEKPNTTINDDQELMNRVAQVWCSKNVSDAYQFILGYMNNTFLMFRVISSISYYLGLAGILFILIQNITITFAIMIYGR